MKVAAYPSPKLPYDDLDSVFIRDEIRTGAFSDTEYRSYVNCLVHVEWYATQGVHPNSTGLSAAGATAANWRVATKYPDAYDAVRRDCGKPTRAETDLSRSTDEDSAERRRRATRHREQWRAVCDEQRPDTSPAHAESDTPRRTHASGFRFPTIPYHKLESTFVREELRRGSFDDLEHRRYVNRLVYLEACARDDCRLHKSGYPDPRRWQVAAIEPTAYDCIRSEFGKNTRTDLIPIRSRQPDEAELRRHARQWRRVQEQRTNRGDEE